MKIRVLSVRVVNGEVLARVHAENPPRFKLRVELRFPAPKERSPWVAAYDEALKYLDVA